MTRHTQKAAVNAYEAKGTNPQYATSKAYAGTPYVAQQNAHAYQKYPPYQAQVAQQSSVAKTEVEKEK